MSMSSVAGIAKGYAGSLRGARDGKIASGSVASQVVLPLLLGISPCFVGWSIPDFSNAVAGISIVASLLCSVAALLFQVRIDLRGKLEEDKRHPENEQHFLVSGDLDLLDEMFSQVMWVILEGFALVLLMILDEWLGLSGHGFPLTQVVSFLVISGVGNFVVVIGAVLKRFNRVYRLIAMNKRS